MHTYIRWTLGISAAALLLGASNCTKNNASDAPQFVTTLTVENTSAQPTTAFATGEAIQFLITIRNRSDQPQSLFFNSSELVNVAVVDTGTASVVWTCDGGTASACVISGNLGTSSNEMDFLPFETKTVTVTWNQTDDAGAQVQVSDGHNSATDTSGEYEVLGGFTVFNTTGLSDAADNGSSMAMGPPTAAQMFPSVYRSTLSAFTIQ